MDIDGPTLQRALCITVISLLLTSDPAISDRTSSCTDDCAPFVPGAVAYWPMTLETNGTDISGNENHATFVGLTYSDGPNGEPNGAVHFHGNVSSYAWINKSQSLDVGKYPGFSFCGFVRFSVNPFYAPLIDWRSAHYPFGLFISAAPKPLLNLYTGNNTIKQEVGFSTMTFTAGSWQFFGVSYEKATGRVTGFMDGIGEQRQLDKNIVAETAKTRKVAFGIRLSDMGYPFNGDMSCMMLFKVALTADDFENVRKFCRKRASTHTLSALPNITVSDITTTTATVSWTESPGAFSRYSITIERSGKALGQEVVYPKSLDSSVLSPSAIMVNLVPGATYRVRVWQMLGAFEGRARTSPWFDTLSKPDVRVKSESITFTMITANSAHVAWEEGIGDFDAYYVDIYPTAGGEKVNPSTVPRGTTTASLQNLSPASYYSIIISTKIGAGTSSPTVKSFQTPALKKPGVRVRSESITFTMITATSANVAWEEGIGDFDAYFVDIYPTTGGAKVNPSTVPRGTTTTSLKHLSPASYYTITIRTKIGAGTSSPTVKSFQTPALTNNTLETPLSTVESLQMTGGYQTKADPQTSPKMAQSALIAAGFCLVVIIALIAVIVILFRRISYLSSSSEAAPVLFTKTSTTAAEGDQIIKT